MSWHVYLIWIFYAILTSSMMSPFSVQAIHGGRGTNFSIFNQDLCQQYWQYSNHDFQHISTPPFQPWNTIFVFLTRLIGYNFQHLTKPFFFFFQRDEKRYFYNQILMEILILCIVIYSMHSKDIYIEVNIMVNDDISFYYILFYLIYFLYCQMTMG